MLRDRLLRNPLAVQRITRRADSANEVGLAKRKPKSANVDIDRAKLDLLATRGIDGLEGQGTLGVRPYRFEELLAGQDSAGPLKQVAEQPILGRSEMDGVAVATYAMGSKIHFEAAMLEPLTGERRA